jgi:hypothetical protein
MAKNMLVHDNRLAGASPVNLAQNTFTVGATTSIHGAFSWIATYAASQSGLDNLIFMCHGYESIVEDDIELQSIQSGGFGLHLCREGLTNRNLTETAVLFGKVNRIILLACAPAGSTPMNVGRNGDGRRFCGELALYTGADVMASSETQMYHGATTGRIDFGAWEGSVYLFPADGSNPRVLANPPRQSAI